MSDHTRHCSLLGHAWEPCLGGVQCMSCGTVDVKRDIVLPDIDKPTPSRVRHIALEIILAVLLLFGALWVNYVRFCL